MCRRRKRSGEVDARAFLVRCYQEGCCRIRMSEMDGLDGGQLVGGYVMN